jgi:hypothetical protein
MQPRGSPCWTGPTPENLLWKHNTRQIRCTLCSPQYQAGPPSENPTLVAFLSFIHTKFNCISGLLYKTVDISPGSLLVRNDLGPKHLSCIASSAGMGKCTLMHWTCHSDKGQGTPVAYPTLSTREIIGDWTQHQPGLLNPTQWHYYSRQNICFLPLLQ